MWWLWCQSLFSIHVANCPRLWNHSFLNLLKSAVTIVGYNLYSPSSTRPFIRSVAESAQRGSACASTAAPSYWSCPTGSCCEKSAWIRSSECHSGGQQFLLSTVLCMNWNKGHPISRLWIFNIKSFCETTFSHCLLIRLWLHTGY